MPLLPGLKDAFGRVEREPGRSADDSEAGRQKLPAGTKSFPRTHSGLQPTFHTQSINQSVISRLMTNSDRPPSNTRRSCLCRIRRCKLSRSASSGRTAPPDTLTLNGHRTHLSGGRADSIHTATTDMDKTVLSVSCLAWRCESALRQHSVIKHANGKKKKECQPVSRSASHASSSGDVSWRRHLVA